jgi:hypothetical protein
VSICFVGKLLRAVVLDNHFGLKSGYFSAVNTRIRFCNVTNFLMPFLTVLINLIFLARKNFFSYIARIFNHYIHYCYCCRYCPSLYEGLKPCPLHKHVHVPGDVDFLTALLEKAEHELSGM